MGVPLFDTATPRAPLRDELRAAIDQVLDSEHFILGPEVSAFERELASYCGASHAVGVANGTDAITIALRAMGVEAGRRGGGSLVHLLRLGRGDRAHGREARVLRHRPGHLLHHARDGAGRARRRGRRR